MLINKNLRKYLLASVSAGAMISSQSAHANPEGANVITGDVTINGIGTDHVIVNNDSMRSIVDWNSFSIGTGETTTINQISNDAAILNRVVGGDITEIYGTLESNGQVYLVNESGILIGASGVIDTNGLVASTLDVSNADFLGAGDMIFSQGIEAGGGITVHGKIRSVTGGDIFLLSREIEIGETGEISSNGGYVGLGAGEEILLRPTDSGDGRISIRAGKGKITNRGTIEGAAAELRAAGGNAYALAINNTGVVRATGVSKRGGRITLTGGGKVRNTGRVVARKKVVVRSTKKIVNSGTVKAGSGSKGGEIIFEAPEIEVQTGSLLDVSGALGGGRMFIGGGFQGSGKSRNGDLVDITKNAEIVTVETGAVLDASATQSGNAGEVVVWSDDATTFAGDIVAAAVDGKGGFAEVSGKKVLTFGGDAKLSGSAGSGELLLDPENITIVHAAAGTPVAVGTINDGRIEDLLEGGVNVTITTGGSGASGTVNGASDEANNWDLGNATMEDGDVTFASGVRIIWSDDGGAGDQDTTFTVHAARDIVAANNVLIQHTEVSEVDNEGGIVFLAGRNIEVGSAAATSSVAIGSEFGTNLFVAGDTDFDSTVGAIDIEAAGNVNVEGSTATFAAAAQIGYQVSNTRATNTGADAFNGAINVHAGGTITLTGGKQNITFAQIGHGGWLQANTAEVAEIAGNINISAGIHADGGDLVLENADGSELNSYAQVGHGAHRFAAAGAIRNLVHGQISGDINIDVINSDVLLNTTYTPDSDGNEDRALAQIGHGGHMTYAGNVLLAGDLVEVRHGAIQGAIEINASGKVELGHELAAASGDDRVVLQSQIGHGGHTQFIYSGQDLTGVAESSRSYDVEYGSIISFNPLDHSSTGYSTDIIIDAAEINVFAQENVLNSGVRSGNFVDNVQRSQIGHGYETVGYRAANPFGNIGMSSPIDPDNDDINISGSHPLDRADPALRVTPNELVAIGTAASAFIDALLAAYAAENLDPPDQATIDAALASGTATVVGSQPPIGPLDAVAGLSPAQEAQFFSDVANLTEAEQEEFANWLEGFTPGMAVSPPVVASVGDQLNITITENRITGDITITDISAATGSMDGNDGVDVSATISAANTAINHDVMIARIGHASQNFIDSVDGGNAGADPDGMGPLLPPSVDAFDGGNITIRQAHILNADITINYDNAGLDDVLGDDTGTVGIDESLDDQNFTEATNQDIKIETSVSASLGRVEDNTVTAQIGHSGDIFARSGNGSANRPGVDGDASDGGDIAIYKGTVWDGALVRDNDNDLDDQIAIINTTNIELISSNEVIVESATSASLAKAARNSAESQIGHGHRIRLETGNGGGADATGRDGGAGGDVLIVQSLDAREYGIDQADGIGEYDDYAYGLRGDITITAVETDGTLGSQALRLVSSDNASLARAENNADYSLLGHSDVIEIVSGNGGAGGSADTTLGDGTNLNTNTEGDDLALDPDGQRSNAGGRGGHIDVQLGRLTHDQDLLVDASDEDWHERGDLENRFFADLTYANRSSDETFANRYNQADLGDTRNGDTLSGDSRGGAVFLHSNATADSRLQGVMLIEGDITVNATGQVLVDSSTNNSLSPSAHSIAESQIGHGNRIFTDSGNGGVGGSATFSANDEPVFVSEEEGERFLNYDPVIGTTRGGNGGDIRLTMGDITDRQIANRISGIHHEIYHDTDADHQVNARIVLNISDAGVGTDVFADSLIVTGAVNNGLGEGKGSDVYSGVGHHVRLFGEGGIGGNGGSTNTEFDADGNSLFNDGTMGPQIGQTDLSPAADAVDETPEQAGAVFIQPNSSGGRGGDVLVVNNNINGDIIVDADRRVTVDTTASHALYGHVASTIGHHTSLIAVTQNGGLAGSLYEPATGTNVVTFDGGIINVGGTQGGENDTDAGTTGDQDVPTFAHRLIDGNQDDKFNLVSNGDATSVEGEDGIAVTPIDIATGKGSTIQSIDTELGSVTDGVSVAGATGVIFHDEEADPEFIIDPNTNTYVENNQANNTAYAEDPVNLTRFGRVVATYDAFHTDTELGSGGTLFDARGQTTSPDRLALQVFVDMDRDGDVDLVDFDRDGRLDIVDLDHDGYMDVIDGRANYVDVSSFTGDADVNSITGLGVLDYVAVTGEQFDPDHLEGGWTITNRLETTDLISAYNGGSDGVTATVGDNRTVFTALVGDLSTANGGRGGDAYTQAGLSIGDISVSTGDPDVTGEETSLVVKANVIDDVVGGKEADIHVVAIGHTALQYSDAGAQYSDYRSGREALRGEWDTHSAANGGGANFYAVNASGGRGGIGILQQGVSRDIDPSVIAVTNEIDHLVGDIFVNKPHVTATDDQLNMMGAEVYLGLSVAASSDSKKVLIESFVDTDGGKNVAIAAVGHHAGSGAFGGNGGAGASHQGPAEGPNGSSQTEIANGGNGGLVLVDQKHLKGEVTLMTGADDALDVPKDADFSVEILATNGAAIVPGGPENTVIAQVGHGRGAEAIAGSGGDGDDGQWSGNGGDGGDATVYQRAILDAEITIDVVSFDTGQALSDPDGYYGNGVKIEAAMLENRDNIVRAQTGHGDLAVAIGGAAGHGTPEWTVNEQRNQTANGGTGGDATVIQTGYSYDIMIDAGSNNTGGYAIDIISRANNLFAGTDAHILATAGHGGLGWAYSGAGGDGGLSGAVNGIQTDGDPNLVDSDYDYGNAQTNQVHGDTPYVIDIANQMVLGTDRRGGDAGDALVVLNNEGTGRVLSRASSANDYGDDDLGGADITLHTNDSLVKNGTDPLVGYDGIRIQSIAGNGSNKDDGAFEQGATLVNAAIVGHHGFANTLGAAGGKGIQSALFALISEGDGGDGGSATTQIGAVWGDISVSNLGNPVGGLDDNDHAANLSREDRDTNILIEAKGGGSYDNINHRAEARIGHMTHASAFAGDGGDASKEDGAPPSFPATISAQGGDGGDATTTQGQLTGDITVNAENSVIFTSSDGVSGAQMTVAAAGHRLEGHAIAGIGGFGGTVVTDGPTSGNTVDVTVSISSSSGSATYDVYSYQGATYYCDGTTCYTEFGDDGTPVGPGVGQSSIEQTSTGTHTQGSNPTVFDTYVVGGTTYYCDGDTCYTGFDGDDNPTGPLSLTDISAVDTGDDFVSQEYQSTDYAVKLDGSNVAHLCSMGMCYPINPDGSPNTGAGVPDAGFNQVTRPVAATPIYFTYEALREYHARSTENGNTGNEATTGIDETAFNSLSEFEQKLVAPFRDYFENKPHELELFLDTLIGDDADVIAANERDENFVGNTDFTIAKLGDGDRGSAPTDQGEIETMIAIMAASGHGGNGVVVQGSNGLDGVAGDELVASGNISLTANAHKVDDIARGIVVEAKSDSTSVGMQLAHIGHQAEVVRAVGGDGQDLNGNNANSNGIGGDGGDAIIDQYAINGNIGLYSEHKLTILAEDSADGADETRAWVGHRLTVGPDHVDYRTDPIALAGNGGSESGDVYDDGHNGNGGDVFIWQRGVVSGSLRPISGSPGVRYGTEIALVALEDSDDDNSITIKAAATGASAPDVEAHVGHDFMIVSAKAGDAGRQGGLTGPMGAGEGLLEGNGGDIFIHQSDLGADIDIAGRDQVLIETDVSPGGNHAHLMIGHERTIGLSADPDNPRSGTIIAGYGGDSRTEQANGTDMASIEAAQAGVIEDADSGRIEITLGKLGDSTEAHTGTGEDDRLVTILSVTEDVDILAKASDGGDMSLLEIGNQQQVYAKTLSAAEYTGVPFAQTAGDVGGVYIARDTIHGDILIQALDVDRSTTKETTIYNAMMASPLRTDVGRQVVIDTDSGLGIAEVQIGHETDFDITTSEPDTARAAFGEDREYLYNDNLKTFIGLTDPALVADGTADGTGLMPVNTNPQATFADAQNAVEDMKNIVAVLGMALGNIDRYPADDGADESTLDAADFADGVYQQSELGAIAANVDRGELQKAYDIALTAYNSAKAALETPFDNNTGLGANETSVDNAISEIMGHAETSITASMLAQAIFDSGAVPQAQDQFADFAEAGDITYANLLTQSHHIQTIRSLDPVSDTGFAGFDDELTAQGTTRISVITTASGVTTLDTGDVQGDITVRSGWYSGENGIDWRQNGGMMLSTVVGNDAIVANNFTSRELGMGGMVVAAANVDDTLDSVVQITATTGAGGHSLTEVGHRRAMINTTLYGGGDSNASPEEGGVAGDGGSITTKNTTSGDIDIRAEEVIMKATGGSGAQTEIHLLHSSLTQNYAVGWSDIQAKLGNGGDITNTTSVSGGVAISAERFASSYNSGDRKLLAMGASGDDFIHFGHQVADDNISNSDKVEAGNKGDGQDNLGSNRGGDIVSTQTVSGNADGDLVTVNLDVNNDGGLQDFIIEALGASSDTDIRLGNGDNDSKDITHGVGPASIYHRGVSGGHNLMPVPTTVNGAQVEYDTITDDGGAVTLTQNVSGDIHITKVEDIEINVLGSGDPDIWIGHDAEQFGQSGDINEGPGVPGYGERVTVDQTVMGAIDITDITGSFYGQVTAAAGEWHMGHEATQTAFSADDSANPSDFEDINGDGIADGNAASATGVNDNLDDQADVRATQTVDAPISITAIEITLEAGAGRDLQIGHEAFHIASVDGDLMDADGLATGHVFATSRINNSDNDIVFIATGAAPDPQSDTVVNHVTLNRDDGDIELLGPAANLLEVGHRSTSIMSDGPTNPEGQYNTEQTIGSFTDADGDGEVDNTAQSVISFTAAQDIVIDGAEAQVGHYITEAGIKASSQANVDDDASTGLAAGDSELRQVVGSDILIGDKTKQSSGGTGDGGAGNSFYLFDGRVGHFSPDTNGSQVEPGTGASVRSVTVQLLDGDITVEAGTDADMDAPNGGTLTTAAAAVDDTLNVLADNGDDIFISGGAIGHHHAAGGDAPAANETQVAAGDVWVRAGGDLHAVNGRIGHDNYEFTDFNVGPTNATPEGQVAGIRNRVRGLTTVGAGQNSAPEDSILIADVMLFQDTNVNSGYGGQGDADVDGELRFFLPAQEGLTIEGTVLFNDSGSNGDPTSTRSGSETNIFEGQGGADHEHDFTLMAENAPYTDQFIGLGNFTFYFESSAEAFPEYTPYINEDDFEGGYTIIYTRRGSNQNGEGTVNIGRLGGGQYFGTGSFELSCEEQAEAQSGQSADEISVEACEEARRNFIGQQPGYGSNTGFSGTAGGNQNFGHNFDFDETHVETIDEESGSSTTTALFRTELGARPVIEISYPVFAFETTTVEMSDREMARKPVAKKDVVISQSSSYSGTIVQQDIGNTFGEYVEGAEVAKSQIKSAYPGALSYASTFTVYEEKKL